LPCEQANRRKQHLPVIQDGELLRPFLAP